MGAITFTGAPLRKDTLTFVLMMIIAAVRRGEPMSEDTISRQAAIDAIEQMQMPIMRSEFPEEQFVFTGMSEALQAIKELPSAQPEIIRCKDCKHKYIENMVWVCPFGLPGGEEFYCGYGAEPYKGEQE